MVASIATGCVGAIERDEFDAMIQERGGGISGDLAARAVSSVAAATDTTVDEIRLASLNLTVASVSMSVRPPDFPNESDTWTVSLSGDRYGPFPDSDSAPDRAFSFGGALVDAALVEALVDDALERTTVRSAWVSGVTFDAAAPDTMMISVTVTNERSTETFDYAADGTLVGRT
jgi:hypothetical protein